MRNDRVHQERRNMVVRSAGAALFLTALLTATGTISAMAGDDEPIELTSEVTPPERIAFVKPEYPETAKKERQEGKVIIEIIVGRTGGVEAAKLLKSNPTFDASAMAAVVQWKYRPALKDGKPVRVYLTVIIDFTLDEREA